MRIGFNLAIFEDHNKWESLFSKSGKTRWPNKAWEIEGHNFGWGDLLTFEFTWTRKCDHAGFSLKLGLFGYQIEGRLYDSRHWDYDTNSYLVYDEAYFQSCFKGHEPLEISPDAEMADKLSEAEQFLASPQVQRIVDPFYKRVDENLEALKQEKLDKQARGEAHRAANLAKKASDQS